MSANDRFSAATRSASFVLTLSHAQIGYLVGRAKEDELRTRFDWYEPTPAINFGHADELAAALTTSTIRSLVRRGLLDIFPTEPPTYSHDIIRFTRAGLIMVALLEEAGFVAEPSMVRPVPSHPDDRPKIAPTGPNGTGQWLCTGGQNDRRFPLAVPADEPFLAHHIKGREPAGSSS